MCGFAGIVRFDGGAVEPARLRRMAAQVAHRGPDGAGESTHGPCGLVHARLAIIDLLSGQQPMHLEGVGLHLVFNGEIYNHRDLRAKLQKRGHAFRSDHSDTEVLLLGYREWGEMLPKHLHGMFAFAIWDERKQELFLCRDRAGKKPLYLRRTAGEVSFGSLVATLVAGADETPRVDREAILTFLRYGYPFERSMVAGITEVPAAHWMRIGRDGTTTCGRYWRPPPISLHSSSIGAVDALREVLGDAVAARLQADVPLGCFLSGGIDSSVIAALAQKTLTGKGADRLKTFNVAMPDVQYDESEHALAVARHVGTEHTTLEADPSRAADDLELLMAIAGEPTADSSLLPTHWLCKAARQHVKVALSGDGGDELFGGYDRYRALRLLARWRAVASVVPEALLRDSNPRSRKTRVRRLVEAAKAGPHAAQQYHAMIHLFGEAEIAELMPDAARGGAEGGPAVPDWIEEHDVVHAAMRWDLTHYLPFELLRKLDRASMAVALEVRCPLLDTAVCDLAGHLPGNVLMPGNRPKGLLRALAAEMLPTSIVTRPKRGFAVPIGRWFRTTLRDPLAAALQGEELASLGLEASPARRMFREHDEGKADHTHRLFALWQLVLWARWLRNVRS